MQIPLSFCSSCRDSPSLRGHSSGICRLSRRPAAGAQPLLASFSILCTMQYRCHWALTFTRPRRFKRASRPRLTPDATRNHLCCVAPPALPPTWRETPVIAPWLGTHGRWGRGRRVFPALRPTGVSAVLRALGNQPPRGLHDQLLRLLRSRYPRVRAGAVAVGRALKPRHRWNSDRRRVSIECDVVRAERASHLPAPPSWLRRSPPN